MNSDWWLGHSLNQRVRGVVFQNEWYYFFESSPLK